jgi:hypothetical protein
MADTDMQESVVSFLERNGLRQDILTRLRKLIGARILRTSVADVTIEMFIAQISVLTVSDWRDMGPLRALKIKRIFDSYDIHWN